MMTESSQDVADPRLATLVGQLVSYLREVVRVQPNHIEGRVFDIVEYEDDLNVAAVSFFYHQELVPLDEDGWWLSVIWTDTEHPTVQFAAIHPGGQLLAMRKVLDVANGLMPDPSAITKEQQDTLNLLAEEFVRMQRSMGKARRDLQV